MTMQLKGIDYVLYLKSPCGENQAILRHEEFFFFQEKTFKYVVLVIKNEF